MSSGKAEEIEWKTGSVSYLDIGNLRSLKGGVGVEGCIMASICID